MKRNELTSTLMANINTNITDNLALTVVVGQDYNKRTYRNSVITGTELAAPGLVNTNNIAAFDPGYNYETKKNIIWFLWGCFFELQKLFVSELSRKIRDGLYFTRKQ